MHRILVLTERDELSRALASAARASASWTVGCASELVEAERRLIQDAWDVLLVDAALLEPAAKTLLAKFTERDPSVVFVALEFAPMPARRAMLLELGAADIVHVDPGHLGDRDQATALLRMAAVRLECHRDARAAKRHNERRDAELLGMNALVHGLSKSLDRSTIIFRTLNILSNLCARGAVAYLEVYEPAGDAPAQEVLFSESEAEVLAEREEPERNVHLRVVEQLASDRLLVCSQPQPHPSWTELMTLHRPVALRQRPAPGLYPGLAPLWHRLRDGVAYLVPVWGRSRVLGVLVVADLGVDSTSAFSAQSLQAMAAYLGGALENAQLFLEIKDAYQSLQTAQDQLVHSEKFAAVGHLSAQIAHEINNPASFVISNLSVMMDYVTSMRGFVTELDRVASTHLPALAPHLARALDAHDIEYLRDDLDVLLERSLAGMQRIHQIVQDLRYFAYDAGPEPGWVDLEAIIDASISLIRHELRHRARVERDFEAAPEVYSDANKLSQVFLNLLVNASQALEYGSPEDDYVRVGTMSVGDNVLIYMEDTGQGIAPEHLGRIFEPFFTTKERGQGTGLGLSISRDILRSLGGDIRVYSRPGEGTRFEVLLPVRAPGAPASIDTFVPL